MFVYLGVSKIRCRWRYRGSAMVIINNPAPGKVLHNNHTTPHTKIIHTINIMFTMVHLLLSVLNNIIYISSVCIPAYICVVYPMRTNVHRCVYMREKGWEPFMNRLRSYTIDCIYLYLCILKYVYICIVMAPKLKPSSKEYIRDKNNRMTNRWFIKHYTIASTSTAELVKLFSSPSYSKKKNVIKKELNKRGISV